MIAPIGQIVGTTKGNSNKHFQIVGTVKSAPQVLKKKRKVALKAQRKNATQIEGGESKQLPEDITSNDKGIPKADMERSRSIRKIKSARRVEKRRKKELERERKRVEELEERNRLIKENGKPYYIIWDDIIFGKDVIRFSRQRIDDLLYPVEFEGSIEKLNEIKKEYFQRVHGKSAYKLIFYNSKLVKSESPGWSHLQATIEEGLQYFEFRPPKLHYSFERSFSKPEFSRTFKEHISRNPFLKALALAHHKDFPIISINESRKNSDEESFIFQSYTTRGEILILWENINENRATHVFKTTQKNYDSRFKAIQSFISTPTNVKRYLLYLNDPDHRQMKKELGYVRPVYHSDLRDYKAVIKNVLGK